MPRTTQENHTRLSQVIWSLGMNLQPPEYEAGVVPTQQ
jgi:hypothetical protein